MRKLGEITWHASGEDTGPDCGIEVSLGGGKALYIGEMAGHDDWQIALIDGDAMCALADVTSNDLARDLADEIVATLKEARDAE